MDVIEFAGVIVDGMSHHKELGVPGKPHLPSAPDDWPVVLYPGSLNIGLNAWPGGFATRELKASVESLDTGLFVPEFEIDRDQFARNLIHPRAGVPRGGDAQVWRAKVIVAGVIVSPAPPCWVLRRFGSRVGEQLELVSGVRLRDAFRLKNGIAVLVRLYGFWRTA